MKTASTMVVTNANNMWAPWKHARPVEPHVPLQTYTCIADATNGMNISVVDRVATMRSTCGSHAIRISTAKKRHTQGASFDMRLQPRLKPVKNTLNGNIDGVFARKLARRRHETAGCFGENR